jgi:hypothetical protein
VALQKEYSSDRDDTGFNPARDFYHSVRLEGAAALFDQKLQVLNSKYSKDWYLRNVDGLLDQSFHEIEEFLVIAAKQDVEVFIFTNPFHQSYWDMLKHNDLLNLYEDWMDSIEATVKSNPEIMPVALWNFSEDSAYIHESVPGQKVLNKYLDWFWEPAHYRRELGDKMVNSLLSKCCNSVANFGRRVF